MGVFDRIGKELERSGRKFEKEVIRPYAREFERIPGIGDLTRSLHESRKAQRQAANEARKFQIERRNELMEERLRMSERQELLQASRERTRREEMAESLVTGGLSYMDTANMSVVDRSTNSIPTLDPIDELGNTVPEVT